jgi:hypothetical protein
MTITEPTTLATDYILAALVFYLAFRLTQRSRQTGQASTRLWARAFTFSAVAGVTGGTYHGFARVLGPGSGLILWKVTVYAIGLAGFFLLVAAALASLTGMARRWVILAGLVEFLFYAVWMGSHNDFRFVIYDYGPALLAVLLLQLLRAGEEPTVPWVAGGILASFAAAGIQASGFDLYPNFNHNDIYHLVQMGAFYLLYRGGRLLRDRRE